jgi:hypothetical protein
MRSGTKPSAANPKWPSPPAVLLAVLNPGGKDPKQSFAGGPGSPDDPGHAPINYHAYAACVGGGFYRKAAEVPPEARAVLVLLRCHGLDEAQRAVRSLQERGQKVFLSWKESGLHQVADALADARRHDQFRQLCREADGFLSSTPELVPLYQAAGATSGAFLPTPYPVDFPAWDFRRNVEERSGIFLGTREFSVPSRNHLLAVSIACSLGAVTVINPDGSAGERLLRSISSTLNILPGPLPYAEYLRLMASHRLVFQLDRSTVPGQVAGDALLARVPCLGGNGAVDRLAFEPLCGPLTEAAEKAQRLLTDDEAYRRELARSEDVAQSMLSFAAMRALLTDFLA